MGWPVKLRSMSFAITFAVVMMECAIWGLPIGLGLWWWQAGSAASIARWIAGISITLSLVIAVQAHVRAPRWGANARVRAA